MMSSMYSGISGLKMHQKKMDVIGNNIANVNTVGYKKGQVTFKEVFSQTVKGAGGAQGGKGGTNPQQVGLGGQLGAINTVHTQGAIQRTSNPTDLMIDGEGYFIISDDENLNTKYYTRAGNFVPDENGNLVTSDGFKVLGYGKDGSLSPIEINYTDTVKPTASSYIEFVGNLNSEQKKDTSYSADTIIKDSLGNSYRVNMSFTKTGKNDKGENNWRLDIINVKNAATGEEVTLKDKNTVTLSFDQNGKLISDDSTKNFNIDFDASGLIFGSGEPGAPNRINIDLSRIKQFSGENTASGHDGGKDGSLKGISSGSLKGFSIDNFGNIIGSYTNGVNKSLGQIALAKFDNSSGLEKIGNNSYKDTSNSGAAQMGTSGTRGLGSINAGALEMSNVDLSLEFTEMITTQRGFQANSRIITTSDEMLQELVNLKR